METGETIEIAMLNFSLADYEHLICPKEEDILPCKRCLTSLESMSKS